MTASTPPAVRQLRLVVQVDDIDAALRFYRDALGLTERAAFEGDGDARVAILEAGVATLELANPAQVRMIDGLETDGDTSDPLRIAFEVDDAAAATAALADAGAELVASPRETPWRSLNSRLRSPDGLQLTLFEELGAAPEDDADDELLLWQRAVDRLDGLEDPDGVVERMRVLAARYPGSDGVAHFELGGALDSAGHEAEAAVEYERAVVAGLDDERLARLSIQYASTLRNLGRTDEAIVLLSSAQQHPSIGAAREVFLALALHSAGRTDEALRTAIEALAPTLPRYRRSVAAYAADLTDSAPQS
ncbi:putative glyoxalase superfamily protein PhnB [Rathayibacter sp. PhB93]|uniref:tetratricopeptide repeat protein n=1 Tax=unclassified Rathayibacter TaxID=2609250 RepID=UPI000FB9FA06|nr:MULTISPECIES: tetratricopeptide repeat protein [unclassified Rathayibacter]ROQ05188.1 putative glyoxalase superfamily protein PhnB [Rathayibacter sp. PhB93]TDQ12741.1 putative glyoxalase superfamily protein PhnB [Rathayibacter sp. PhB1]